MIGIVPLRQVKPAYTNLRWRRLNLKRLLAVAACLPRLRFEIVLLNVGRSWTKDNLRRKDSAQTNSRIHATKACAEI